VAMLASQFDNNYFVLSSLMTYLIGGMGTECLSRSFRMLDCYLIIQLRHEVNFQESNQLTAFND
jgi:hypothetical protein